MNLKLMKGNDAVVHGALLAGCQAYFGYPITPASEVAHTAARLFPASGRVFLQAESELAAINMVYGASSAGVRCITASSGPGMSLKMEGISYLAGAELPAVIVDIGRVGPGLGNIYPDQSDYNQLVKGGGNGSYHAIVLAPNSVQEMCDLTMLAFDLADRYRTPVFVLADAYVGQMMEPVALPPASPPAPEKPWALTAEAASNDNVVTSIYLDMDEMEELSARLQRRYDEATAREVRYEGIGLDDADIVLVAFGIVSRILHSLMERARAEGLRVGLLRPISLWPFPTQAVRTLAERAKAFLVVEMNNGQMVDDVRLAVEGRRPVAFVNRLGGNMPEATKILEEIRRLAAATHPHGA